MGAFLELSDECCPIDNSDRSKRLRQEGLGAGSHPPTAIDLAIANEQVPISCADWGNYPSPYAWSVPLSCTESRRCRSLTGKGEGLPLDGCYSNEWRNRPVPAEASALAVGVQGQRTLKR
jgi:hypothetical protein